MRMEHEVQTIKKKSVIMNDNQKIRDDINSEYSFVRDTCWKY